MKARGYQRCCPGRKCDFNADCEVPVPLRPVEHHTVKTDMTWKEHDHIMAKCPVAPLKKRAWQEPMAADPSGCYIGAQLRHAGVEVVERAAEHGFYKLTESEDDR